MNSSDASEVYVKALNTDNRSEVENLCSLFKETGLPLGYPGTLTERRAWTVLAGRCRTRCTSITSGDPARTSGHVGLKSSQHGSLDLELVLAVGKTAPIVSQLQHSRVIEASRTLTFFGPTAVFESGKFEQLGLHPSATVAQSGWMYAVTAAKERALKAMAIFVPDTIAKETESTLSALGLNRKRKHRQDSHEWAVPADMGAVTAVDRKAGLFAINPSLIQRERNLPSAAQCMMVNIFDPAAEDFIEQALRRGYEFSGVVPRLSGIDYVVLSLTNTQKVTTLKGRIAAKPGVIKPEAIISKAISSAIMQRALVR